MTGQTQTRSYNQSCLFSLKIIWFGLCVRLPRLFALITGWMVEPLLVWCFFCFFVGVATHRRPFRRPCKTMAKLNSPGDVTQPGSQPISFVFVNVCRIISLNGRSSVRLRFLFSLGRSLWPTQNPREWFILFYDSFLEPKPIRFAIDKPPSQQ